MIEPPIGTAEPKTPWRTCSSQHDSWTQRTGRHDDTDTPLSPVLQRRDGSSSGPARRLVVVASADLSTSLSSRLCCCFPPFSCAPASALSVIFEPACAGNTFHDSVTTPATAMACRRQNTKQASHCSFLASGHKSRHAKRSQFCSLRVHRCNGALAARSRTCSSAWRSGRRSPSACR